MRQLALIVLAILPAPLLADQPPATRIVTAEQRKSCEYLGMVAIGSAWAWHTPRSALKQAMRKVEKMGGNGLFLIGQTSDALNGATATGEALKCPAGAL